MGFEGLLMVTGSSSSLVTQAQDAVVLADKEQAEKKEKAEKELMGAKGSIRTSKKFDETVAKPSVTPAASTSGLTTIDDGLGNSSSWLRRKSSKRGSLDLATS